MLQTTALQHKVTEATNPVKVLGLIWNTQTDSIDLSPCTSSGNSPNEQSYDGPRLSTRLDITGHNFCQTIPLVIMAGAHLPWHHIEQQSSCQVEGDFGCHQMPLHYHFSCLTLCTSCKAFTLTSMLMLALKLMAYIQQDQGLPSLVVLKSRAAPLKQLTLPRLELKAAVLAAKLSSFIKTLGLGSCIG